MAATKFYEGQEFHNPNDPTAPVLVYRGGKFLPQDASGRVQSTAPISPTDAKAVADIQGQASSMDSLASTSRDFINRNQRTPTGGLLAIPGATTIAKALGVGGDDLAAMDRDSVGMATALRAPGQRLTQMEFLKNLGAGPSVHTAIGANTQTDSQIQNGNALAQAKASFFTTYLSHKRSLDGAIPAWLNFKAQHFGSDGAFSKDPITDQQAAGQALKAVSTQAKTPTVLNPADYLGNGGGDD
jgi:hypothetical protein